MGKKRVIHTVHVFYYTVHAFTTRSIDQSRDIHLAGGGRPHWVPAPGQTFHRSSGPPPSFPLCLVCDGRTDEAAEDIEAKISVDREAMGKADQRSSTRQQSKTGQRREKVGNEFYSPDRVLIFPFEQLLQSLWEMDGGSSGQRLQRWHDILAERAASNGNCSFRSHEIIVPT